MRAAKLWNWLDKVGLNSCFVLISVLLFAALFVLYYPAFFGMLPDEQEHLRQAYLFHTSQPFVQDALHAYNFTMQEIGFLPHYVLGQSLLLFPFLFFGWNAVFLLGLFVHLFGIFVFYKILKKLGIDVRFTVLYVFFPVFAFFSRTIMTDYVSAVLFLCAFYFYLLPKPRAALASGLFFGVALFFRETNILAFLAFLAVALLWKRKKIIPLLSGFVPFFVCFLLLNNFLYGGFFATGRGVSLAPDFLFFPIVFAKLVLLLAVLYPLMAFAPLFYKKPLRKEILFSVLFFMLFFSLCWDIDLFPLSFNKLITHARYLVPVMPLLLVAYCSWLHETLCKAAERLFSAKAIAVAWIVVLILLFAAGFAVFLHHDSYLRSKLEVHEMLFSSTGEGALIVGNMDDFSYLGEAFGDRRYVDYKSVGLDSYFSDFDSYVMVSHNLNALGAGRLEAIASDYNGVLVGKTGGAILVEVYSIPKPKTQKEFVLDYYTPTQVLEPCEPVDGSSEWCFHDLAIAQKNPEFCEKPGSRVPDCYFDVAVEFLEPGLCEKSKYWADMCFIEIAERAKNPGLCESAGTRKSSCYHNLAVLTGDQELCRLSGRFEEKCLSYWSGEAPPKYFPKYVR